MLLVVVVVVVVVVVAVAADAADATVVIICFGSLAVRKLHELSTYRWCHVC